MAYTLNTNDTQHTKSLASIIAGSFKKFGGSIVEAQKEKAKQLVSTMHF